MPQDTEEPTATRVVIVYGPHGFSPVADAERFHYDLAAWRTRHNLNSICVTLDSVIGGSLASPSIVPGNFTSSPNPPVTEPGVPRARMPVKRFSGRFTGEKAWNAGLDDTAPDSPALPGGAAT